MQNKEQHFEIGANHGGARPMKVVIDRHGNEWLCDRHADNSADLASQGCWDSGQMAFDRNY